MFRCTATTPWPRGKMHWRGYSRSTCEYWPGGVSGDRLPTRSLLHLTIGVKWAVHPCGGDTSLWSQEMQGMDPAREPVGNTGWKRIHRKEKRIRLPFPHRPGGIPGWWKGVPSRPRPPVPHALEGLSHGGSPTLPLPPALPAVPAVLAKAGLLPSTRILGPGRPRVRGPRFRILRR